jgi:NADH-quinone oxidoreductase subunit L
MSLYIIFLPLISAIFCGIFNKKLSHNTAWFITSAAISISAVLALILFVQVAFYGATEHIRIMNWVSSGSMKADWAIYVDKLTAIMFVVVTSVSTLVHIYSYGYMHEDTNLPRFMSYLSLFTFGMLALVSSDNFLQLFFGWEAVGLCSYLLIGFWYKKDSACQASMKAFIVNRVGDFGLALGVFLIYKYFGTIEFSSVFPIVPKLTSQEFAFGLSVVDIICLLLFLGCMGKSAQIGLHVWLPDAMEGPTPVSALIHAATMVTAGVFLLARCSFLYEYSEITLTLIIIIGMVTCLFAATIAITQNDIKKVIAYSTCSQLGYMFFACGVSAYQAAIFHLATHAFFKALLFLCAGSVIHAMDHEQDIQKMGGLWKKIPQTYALFLIGSLAIIGVFPFAGFYSKDLILESAYASENPFGIYAFYFGVITAFLTALYSIRLLILVFHLEPRATKKIMSHIHESPASMLIPLYILAFGAVCSGMFGIYILNIGDIHGFFDGVIFNKYKTLEHVHHVPEIIKLSPSILGFAGILVGYLIYTIIKCQESLGQHLSLLYNLSNNKYYVDEIYNIIFVKPLASFSNFCWQIIDIRLIDGLGPNSAAYLSDKFAKLVSKMQTGYVFHYAFCVLFGLVLILSAVLWR